MRRTLLPGLLLLAAIGLVGYGLSSLVPKVNVLIVTILLGIVVGNAYGVPDWASSGVGTHKLWLEVGIVIMGARVALGQVLRAGPTLVALIVATVTATIVLVELLARHAYTIPEETGSLLAAGSGICGVSAVVAVAQSIRVDQSDIAYAATTILLFDSTTLFVYPIVGHALGLSNIVFGVWAGLTMFSTGPVTAAGFAFSRAAGQWALIVKLARNSLIGIAAILYAVYYGRRRGDDDAKATDGVGDTARFLWDMFPKFIIGFLGVMAVANLGLLDATQVTSLSHASDWAFTLAFAGVGLEFQVDDLRDTGYKPVLTVLTGLLVMSTVVLLVVQTLF